MSDFQLSRRQDTLDILGDDGTVVVVSRITEVHDTIPVRESATSVFSATVHINRLAGRRTNRLGRFPGAGMGELQEATHAVYWSFTSTIMVADRLSVAGDSSYFEVLGLDEYDDHKRAWTKRVENRS